MALSTIAAIVSLAISLVGTPYSYGSHSTKAMDCSGLVYYCYLEVADIELERTAKNQGYDNTYQKIETIDELQEGDIVCFDTNPYDGDLSDHTGIFIGNNEFVHSSSSRGEVIISPIDEGFYNECFSWGRRIAEE